jgi:hypothetical protein
MPPFGGLKLATETIRLLDRWECDWPAFLRSRIASYKRFHDERLPNYLHIVDTPGEPVSGVRKQALSKMFYDVRRSL